MGFIRFNHRRNSWQRTLCGWRYVDISAQEAKDLYDLGYKVSLT
jgi:hypothetical protein